MTERVKRLTHSVSDLRKVSETYAREFWATWIRGKTYLKMSASDFYTHEKRWGELSFNKIATTFTSSLFMVDKWEMSPFLAMDIYGNPNPRPTLTPRYMSTHSKRLHPHRCENFKLHTSTTFRSTYRSFRLLSEANLNGSITMCL